MTKNDIELIFKQHYMRMYRLAASILYDEDESKDVVSEVFSHLLASGATLRPETTEAYLLTGVRNQCRNVIERKKVRERLVRLLSVAATAPRQIFRLRYLREMTCQEVADTLGVSRQTVHHHLRESIEKIRLHLKSIQ